MNKSILIIVIIFTLAVIATYYLWQKADEIVPAIELEDPLNIPKVDEKTTMEVPATVASKSETTQTTDLEYEPTSAEKLFASESIAVKPMKPLPQLDESDEDIAAAITKLTDPSGLFSFKSFIRHFVVTVDNMTNQKIPQRYVFTQRVPGKFAVIKQDVDTVLLDSKNFERYAGFVNLAEHVDTKKLVSSYIRFYPLFQEAYEELGYPDRYFNDRLIQVIDHLLKAPDVDGSIKLVKPKVFWLFDDPKLELLSAGQKILLRIGHKNAQRVKAKLRELRAILTTLPAL